MSTRTIIEINHDELARLEADPIDFLRMLFQLRGSSITGRLNAGEKRIDFGSGLYVIAQRHHSETLNLTIK